MRLLGPMIDFPVLTSRTLSNDLRLVVCSAQSSRVHAALVIGSGSAADAAGHEGLAHLAEHTSVAEARGFPGHGLWQHLRFEGGEINAQTSVDATTFLVRLPAPSWPKALAALAAIARSGAPSGGVFERERRAVLDEMPLVPEPFEEAAGSYFGNHPYAHPVRGTRTSVRSITAASIARFKDGHYGSRNSALVLVGPCEPDAVCKTAAELFGEMPAGAPIPPPPAFEPAASSVSVRRLRARSARGHLSFWLPMPDSPAALMVARVLGSTSGPLEGMLFDSDFPSLSIAVDAWLARAARIVRIEVRCQAEPPVEREELVSFLGALHSKIPEPAVVEAARGELLGGLDERRRSASRLCEELAESLARAEQWPALAADTAAGFDALPARWSSLLDPARALVAGSWPGRAGRKPAWPARDSAGEARAGHPRPVRQPEGRATNRSLATAERTVLENGATVVVRPAPAKKFVLSAGFLGGTTALSAALAALGAESWHRFVHSLRSTGIALRRGSRFDYAWIQITGPHEEFGRALVDLMRLISAEPDSRCCGAARAWESKQRLHARPSLPDRLFREVFPEPAGTEAAGLGFVARRSIWALTGETTERDRDAVVGALGKLREGASIAGSSQVRTGDRRKVLWETALIGSICLAWALPPEAASIEEFGVLRWLAAGRLFETLRAGRAAVYRGGALRQHYRRGGIFALYAVARPWKAFGCLRRMREVMQEAAVRDLEAAIGATAAFEAAEEGKLQEDPEEWGLELLDRTAAGRSLEPAAVRYRGISPASLRETLVTCLKPEDGVAVAVLPGFRALPRAFHKVVRAAWSRVHENLARLSRPGQ